MSKIEVVRFLKRLILFFNICYLLSFNNTNVYLLRFCLIFTFNQNVSPLEHHHEKEEAQSRPKSILKLTETLLF